jgi:hypothetical protein
MTLLPDPNNGFPLWRFFCDPGNADCNGAFNSTEGAYAGNGMPDLSFELKMLTTIFAKPDGWCVTGPLGKGVDKDTLALAWDQNFLRLRQDIAALGGMYYLEQSEEQEPLIMAAWYSVSCPLLLMGGEGNFSALREGILKALVRDTVSLDPADYLSFPGLLTPDGDADMDGFSNKQEYDILIETTGTNPDSETYVEAILDPSITPAVVKQDSDTDGLKDVEEDVNLNKAVDDGETDPFNADTDSDGLSDGAEVQWGSDPLSAESKAEVPVVSAGALALLGVALGGLGARRLRRK